MIRTVFQMIDFKKESLGITTYAKTPMNFLRTLLRLGSTSFQIRKKFQKLFTDELTPS